jgi:hypothetical protein
LLARFSHYIDCGRSKDWAMLFTADGTMSCDGTVRAQGTSELIAAVESVCDGAASTRRHLITSIVIDPGANRREVAVQASGLVIDMAQGGLAEFHDYHLKLAKVSGWRIRHLSAHQVGCDFAVPSGLFGLADCARGAGGPPFH